MATNKTYAVFGLGRYGRAVATQLVKDGEEVLAVDVDENKVNDAIEYIPVCRCADVTDEYVIEQLGIADFDVVIIAMGGNLEASVMATMLCKEAGVNNVIVKCSNNMHKKILARVGADKVVFPENESGIRLAKNLVSAGFVDVIELSEKVSMLETDVRDEWVGKNLIELNLRKKYSINVVAIKKDDEVRCDLDPSAPLEENTKLIVIADKDRLKGLQK